MSDSRAVLSERHVFEDGMLLEVEIYRIEDRGQFPSGFKYSFQYCDTSTGETVIRYDNAHTYEDHPDRHHVHRGGDVSPLNYPGDVFELYQQFRRKVEDIRDHGIPG